ncbi:MAG: acyl-CoA thioesterase [Gammaproteobacteria bacterium]|nr:acyl-CoA thioesterase [Gammaproteobacteria bacterium]
MYFDDPPTDRQAMITAVAMPSDTNALGDIFGGWLMSQADIAGAILAYRRAGGRVVTVAVDCFNFILPVYVGDRVIFYADLARTGKTSIKVDLSIFAQSNWDDGAIRRVATGSMIYVHIDEARRPTPIEGDAKSQD